MKKAFTKRSLQSAERVSTSYLRELKCEFQYLTSDQKRQLLMAAPDLYLTLARWCRVTDAIDRATGR